MVCFFHMKGILNHGSAQLGTFLFGSGSIGVPLFFMISGFIMVVTTQNSRPTFAYVKGYYLKRAVRILPLYYILTLVLIIGLGEFRYYFIDHSNELLSGLFFFPTYLNYIGPSYGMPPLEVGWSLCYEVFFYILLGVSIFFGRYRWAVLIGLMAVLVYLIPFITNGEVMPLLSGYYGYTSSYFSLMTNPVILFFIVGVLIGLFYISSHTIQNYLLSQCLAGTAIVVFILSYFGFITLAKSYYSNILVCGLLLFALLLRNKVKPFVLPKPLVFLGDMSYSLYLVHPLVIIFLPRIFRIFNAGVILTSPWYFLVVTSVVLGLSIISYHLIEKQLCSRLTSFLVVRYSK